MTFASTTITVIGFLLPGIAFFGGFYASDRFARDFGRHNPFMDAGLALLAAISLHTIAAILLRLGLYAAPTSSFPSALSATAETIAPPRDYAGIYALSVQLAVYVIITTIIAFVLGRFVSPFVFTRVFQNLGQHQWIRELARDQNSWNRYTKADVLTTLGHEGTYILYEGYLREFFFTKEGKIAYLVLENIQIFSLSVPTDSAKPEAPSTKRPLVSSHPEPNLLIEGDSIQNVLFHPLGGVATDAQALAQLQHKLRSYRGNQVN